MTSSNLPHSPKSTKICSLADCDVTAYGLGYCKKHYKRFKRNGDPVSLKINRGIGTTPEERFWSLVDRRGVDDCWEWQGRREDGYGIFYVGSKKWRTHRYSFFLNSSTVPNLHVLHRCDNPPCVNPNHLYEGTPADNGRDKQERLRAPRGSANVKAKLTEEDVVVIKRRLREGAIAREIAEQFNVAIETIYSIKHNRNWRHVRPADKTMV